MFLIPIEIYILKILIPIESKNQIDLGKHNSYQYRYQFKIKHDTNIEKC